MASGEYIKLLPCDDYLLLDCIEQQVQAFEQSLDRNISLVFSNRTIVDADGNTVLTTGYANQGFVNGFELIRKCVRNGTNIIGEPGAVLFKRSDLQTLRTGFKGELPYVIDLEFWARLLARGNAWCINQPLVTFRIDKNLSVRLGRKRPRNFSVFIDQLYDAQQCTKLDRWIGKPRTYFNELLRRCFYLYLAARLKFKKA
jgi:hypothetical protein